MYVSRMENPKVLLGVVANPASKRTRHGEPGWMVDPSTTPMGSLVGRQMQGWLVDRYRAVSVDLFARKMRRSARDEGDKPLRYAVCFYFRQVMLWDECILGEWRTTKVQEIAVINGQ